MKSFASLLRISSACCQRFRLALFTLLFLPFQSVKAVPEVELFYTNQTTRMWNDSGSGAKGNIAFWAPNFPAGQNYVALSHSARTDYNTQLDMVVARALTGSAFASPTSFTRIWDDSGSGADDDGYVWRPVPPAGYRSLGDVVTGSSSPPALTSVACVRSDLTVEASVGGQLWNSSYTGSATQFTAHKIAAPPGAIDTGGFVGRESSANGPYLPPTGPVYCLNSSAVLLAPAPTNAELEQLIQQFGPKIKFYAGANPSVEPYLPDDPAVILNDPNTRIVSQSIYPVKGVDFNQPNTDPVDNADKYESDAWKTPVELGRRSTSSSTILDDVQSALDHPKANDPHFSYLLKYSNKLGNLSRAKAFVRVQPYLGGTCTEFQFWYFCPWNGTGKSSVKIIGESTGYYDPTGTMGNHYSDWENVRVRVTSKNVWNSGTTSLASVIMSRHSDDVEVAGSDASLEKQGTNPVVYSGLYTHAHYTTASEYNVYDIPKDNKVLTVKLYDRTGNGQVLDTSAAAKHIIVSSAWPSVATTTPDWFFFGGRWGDYLKNRYTFEVKPIYTEYSREIGSGKPGLLRRSEWDVSYPQNPNVGSLRANSDGENLPLSPAFNPAVTAYTLALPSGKTSLVVTPQAADHKAVVEVRVNGGAYAVLPSDTLLGKASDPLKLNPGSNTVEIKVTAPEPAFPARGYVLVVKTYTLTATVTVSALAIEQPAGTPVLPGTVVCWGDNTYGQSTPPPGLGGVIAIAAGAKHTAALTSSGRVVVWGDDSQRQKGFGLAPGSGVTAIAAGSNHTLALKNTGGVVAWGADGAGQTFVPYEASFGVIAVAAGAEHSVALKNDGTVVAWGANSAGQTTLPANLGKAVAIAAGGNYTAALQGDGKVIAWGDSSVFGQTSVPVEAQSGVVAIAAGTTHVVALKNDGTVVNWGYFADINYDGTIKSASPYDAAQPGVVPAGLSGVAAIAAGFSHAVALKNDRAVVAWGGYFGAETNNPAGLNGVIAIAAGAKHTCAVVGAKTPAIAFGSQDVGSTSAPKTFTLKNPGNAPLVPTFVGAVTGNTGDFTVSPTGTLPSIPAGGQATVTVNFSPTVADSRTTLLRVNWGSVANPNIDTTDIPLTGTGANPVLLPAIAIETYGDPKGKVHAWGAGSPGQTGSPHYGQSTVPAGARSGVVQIAAGTFHSVALQAGGTVVAWGLNGYGQTDVPAEFVGRTWEGRGGLIAAGNYHTVAIDRDYKVQAWGAGGPGQTGSPHYGQSTVPAEAQSSSRVREVAAGALHTVARDENWNVMAWGDNSYGQTTLPEDLVDSGAQAIAAGAYHTIALKFDGTVVAWGRNNFGQINVPAGLSGVTRIAAGEFHSVALKQDGTVVAWGSDNQGQTTVPAGLDNVVDIAAGGFHTVALQQDRIVVWGSNQFGKTTVPAEAQYAGAVAAGGQHTLALEGNAWAYFSDQNVGTTSGQRIYTIKNVGTAPLHFDGATITGANPSDFVVNTAATLSTIPVGGQTTITVTFTPKALGFRTATLRVFSDDPGAGTVSFDFRGTGTGVAAPEIALDLPLGTPPVGNVVAWEFNSEGQTTVPVAAQSGVNGIAAGYVHSVALKPDGTVIAWGGNQYGATNVPAELNGVTSIAAGYWHSVALKSDGTVRTWGYGTENTVPAGLNGVRAIAGGNVGFSVALKTDGSVVAWGANGAGQSTVPPEALGGVVAIAAGSSHAVALKGDGRVVAWGDNSDGQTTVPGAALSGVTAIAAGGGHAVALKSDGSVLAWGANTNGQTTVPAAALSGVIAIAAGDLNTMALKSDGSVVTWGYGDFGFNTVPAGAQNGVVAISGGLHALALVGTPFVPFGNQLTGTPSAVKAFTIRNTGTGPLGITSVSTTGGNSADFAVNTTGMLTSIPAGGQTSFSVTFTPAALGARATTLRVLSNDADEATSDIPLTGTGTGLPEIAIDLPPGAPLDGNVVAWGKDDYGQVTAGGDQPGVSAVAAGFNFTVLLDSDGTLKVFGDNSYGQGNIPAGLNGVTAIAAGGYHAAALKSDGTVVAWGYNGQGDPTNVPAGLGWVNGIAAGYLHTVAVKSDGTVAAWGWNDNGQTTVPPGLTGVTAIAAGYAHTVALKSDGTVVAWGYNASGQINVPPGLTSVVAIAVGQEHSVALKNDGTVVAWGIGGDTAVPAGLSGVTRIAAAAFYTVALKSDGTVVAWGYDSYGETVVPTGLSGVIAIAAGLDHAAAVVGTPGASFGNQLTGSTGVARTFTIRNTGAGPLNIAGVSALGGNSEDFKVTTSYMLNAVAGGSQTTFNVAFHPTAAGIRTAFLAISSNDPDEGTTFITLTGRGLTPLENWRQIWFANPDNVGNGASLVDYKNDGAVNLFKFAFGLNPLQTNGAQLPRPQKVGGNLVTSFTQPAGVSGITYGAEWSTTLQAGSWTPIPDTGSGAQHTFSLAIGTVPKLFMRLKVTDPGRPISLAEAFATQSSDYYGGAYLASDAIDGNLTTFTATQSTDPAPTWTLTLPSDTQIGGIHLSNRSDCCGQRLRNITVQVFSDAAGTVPVFTSAVLNPNNELNSPATLSVSPGNVTGRVIRVSRGLSDNPVGDDRVLSLGEVQLTSP